MQTSTLYHRFRAALVLSAALLVWTGCDQSELNIETPDSDFSFGADEDVRPAFDRDGNQTGEISLTRLFAPPSQAELDAALASVSGRDNGVYDYEQVATAATPIGTLYIVSHTVKAGQGDVTHYGAIHVPTGADDLSVLLYNHGGDNGVSAGEVFVLLGLLNPDGTPNPDVDPAVFAFAQNVVLVVPSFRSEELRTAGIPGLGQTYTSTGLPSPWDLDVDDAITLVNVALEQFDSATDEDRIGTLGFSRGGAVSLLATVRDDRFDLVTDFFGPTDFLEAQFQQLAVALLGGTAGSPEQSGQAQALQLPGADFILDALLTPLSTVGPNQPAYNQARQAIILRSAAYYTERMPALQIHHHYGDAVVPVTQSIVLDAQVQAESNGGAYEYNLYGSPADAANPSPSFHSPLAFPASLPATIAFHQANLIGQ